MPHLPRHHNLPLTALSSHISSITPEYRAALASWKPQSIPFLSLPPEVRSIIYNKLLEPLSVIWFPRAFHYEQDIWPIRSLLQTHPQICQELKTGLFGGRFGVRVSVSRKKRDLSGPSLLLLQRLEPLNIKKLTFFGHISHGLSKSDTTPAEFHLTVSHQKGVSSINIAASSRDLNRTTRDLLFALRMVAVQGLVDRATRGVGVTEIEAFMYTLSLHC